MDLLWTTLQLEGRHTFRRVHAVGGRFYPSVTALTRSHRGGDFGLVPSNLLPCMHAPTRSVASRLSTVSRAGQACTHQQRDASSRFHP
ncbi:hypothetical protein BS78_09G246800 [Paspalum vaginatum]|nr:hypothetical protein BS78_09G246800 [Paspalum vaginatum]